MEGHVTNRILDPATRQLSAEPYNQIADHQPQKSQKECGGLKENPRNKSRSLFWVFVGEFWVFFFFFWYVVAVAFGLQVFDTFVQRVIYLHKNSTLAILR